MKQHLVGVLQEVPAGCARDDDPKQVGTQVAVVEARCRIDDEGKSIPGEPAQTREFAQLDEAQNFAADRKGDFDRIVLIRTSGDEQKLIERFRDAERIIPPATE